MLMQAACGRQNNRRIHCRHVMNQHHNISDLEKDQDIPLPGSREKFNIKYLYSNRPPPSMGSKQQGNVKPANQSNHASDELKNIGNNIHLTISK